uniref:CSON007411 protein n=1 Tax=Culicoides sonorensis TaxID=179676 RepID=A0A336LNZ6_CULSO
MNAYYIRISRTVNVHHTKWFMIKMRYQLMRLRKSCGFEIAKVFALIDDWPKILLIKFLDYPICEDALLSCENHQILETLFCLSTIDEIQHQTENLILWSK